MKPWLHLLRKGIPKFAHIEPIGDEWFVPRSALWVADE
jgi:hypothetical protein